MLWGAVALGVLCGVFGFLLGLFLAALIVRARRLALGSALVMMAGVGGAVWLGLNR